MKKKLNPTLTYVLSIIGLLCCCIGGLGLLLSGPAYFIASKQIKAAQLNPEDYEGNISAMNTAKIIALVVTLINVLYLIYTIYQVYTVGWDEMQRIWQDAIEQAQQQQAAQ